MATNDEILREILADDVQRMLLHDTIINREHNGIKYQMVRDDLVLTSMDAARKDEAVRFAEWIVKEDYKPGAGNEHWYKWNGIEPDDTPYTTSELYTLFTQRS